VRRAGAADVRRVLKWRACVVPTRERRTDGGRSGGFLFFHARSRRRWFADSTHDARLPAGAPPPRRQRRDGSSCARGLRTPRPRGAVGPEHVPRGRHDQRRHGVWPTARDDNGRACAVFVFASVYNRSD
jgi:hypothetical protein